MQCSASQWNATDAMQCNAMYGCIYLYVISIYVSITCGILHRETNRLQAMVRKITRFGCFAFVQSIHNLCVFVCCTAYFKICDLVFGSEIRLTIKHAENPSLSFATTVCGWSTYCAHGHVFLQGTLKWWVVLLVSL